MGVIAFKTTFACSVGMKIDESGWIITPGNGDSNLRNFPEDPIPFVTSQPSVE
jgi:hypothetical protein